jgi:hypothetical protein
MLSPIIRHIADARGRGDQNVAHLFLYHDELERRLSRGARIGQTF